MGLRRRIEQRIRQSLAHADSKVDAVADAALELLDVLMQEGVEFELTWGERVLPVKLRMKPDDDEGGE